MRLRPTLQVDHDAYPGGPACIGVHNLDPERVVFLGEPGQAGRRLPAALRVNVIEPGRPGCVDLPDVFGRYEILQAGLRFIPHFPFESGVRYCARVDPRSLWRATRSDVLTLEFSLPNRIVSERRPCAAFFRPPKCCWKTCCASTCGFPTRCSAAGRSNRPAGPWQIETLGRPQSRAGAAAAGGATVRAGHWPRNDRFIGACNTTEFL